MQTRLTLQRPLLALIIVGYLVLGGLYAARTPAWQVPDEPAHYNYIAQVAGGALPVLEVGDWDNDYLEAIKSSGFKPDAIGNRLGTIQYEDHQPPLYYILAAPVFSLTGGQLFPLRLFSVLIGALVVLSAYATVAALFPGQPYLALGTAAFVAFLPQHLAMMAGVNNDCLTELIVGLTLFACVRWLRGGANAGRAERNNALLLGLLLGLGFLTKTTAYMLVFVVAAALLLRARRERWMPARVLRIFAVIAIPAALLGGAWWLRNVGVYGVPDVLGLRRHDAVVVGQQRTAEFITVKGTGQYLIDAVQTTFESFWGRFGWMGVPWPRNIVTLLVFFNVFALMGASVAFVQFRALVSPVQRDGLLVLALTALLALLLFIYYNLSFVQFQGRYLFTALIPFGLYFTAALAGWGSLVQGKAARWLLIVGGGALLAAFAAYTLFRIIIPALAR